MSKECSREKEASPEGGKTDNLEIICGYEEKNNLIRAGKQKTHQAARRFVRAQDRMQHKKTAKQEKLRGRSGNNVNLR